MAPDPSDDLLDALPVGVVVFDVLNPTDPGTLRLAYANRCAASIVDLPQGTLLGQMVADNIPGLVQSGIAARLLEAARESGPRDLGEIAYGDDRISHRVYQATAFPLAGRRVGVILEDATARSNTQEKLREAQGLLETIFSTMKEVVFLVEPSSREIRACNAAVERVFSYRPDELLGRTTELIHVSRASFEEFGRRLFSTLDEEPSMFLEYPLRRKDGSLLDTEITVSATHDAQGWRTGVVSVVRDVTDRQREERRRQERERLYRRVVDTAEEGIWILDADAYTTFANRRLAAMLGYSREDLLLRPVYELVAAEDRETAARCFEEREIPRCDLRFRRRDGTELWAMVSTSELQEENGGEAGLLLMLTDITDRKGAEEERGRLLWSLEERVKELTTLHRAASLLQRFDMPLAEVLEELASALPAGWQYPEITEARATYGDPGGRLPGGAPRSPRGALPGGGAHPPRRPGRDAQDPHRAPRRRAGLAGQ